MVSCGISTSFPVLFPTERKVAHALLTRPPLKQPGASSQLSPLDLHVLSTPPAFVLSQDQTLSFNPVYLTGLSPARIKLIRNYCHNFAFHILYRFQGSVLTLRCPARVSLCILSNFIKKVNTFFSIFSTFLQSFSNSEQSVPLTLRSSAYSAGIIPYSSGASFVCLYSAAQRFFLIYIPPLPRLPAACYNKPSTCLEVSPCARTKSSP